MSNFDIVLADEEDKEKWDQYVHKSEKGTFFHLFDWLTICREETGFNLLPLFIKRGQETVGIAPFFIKSIPGFKIALSPAPRMSTPWAGPIFDFQSDKSYKVEKNSVKVIEAIHKYLVDKIKVDYVSLTTTNKHLDARPFKWLKYKCSPSYTYILNIEDTGKVFKEFDGRIRTGIRNAEETEVLDYQHDDISYIYDILETTTERYKEQGKKFALNKSVFEKILDSKLREHLTAISVTDEEGFVTGNIMIVFKNSVRHWIGGVKPIRNYSGVNEFLHWNGIQRFAEEGYQQYELMGGNTKHLCSHKSKYSGELEIYFKCEWSNYKGFLVNGIRKTLSR